MGSPLSLERASRLHQGHLAALGASPHTRAKYAVIARQFAHWVEATLGHPATVADLDASLLRRWSADLLAAGRSADTVGQYVGYHRTLGGWLATPDTEDGLRLLPRNPLKGLKVPKQSQPHIEIFSDGDIEALLRASLGTRSPLRNRAMLLLLLDTGLRVGEACALHLEDISTLPPQGYVTVRRGKGGRPRELPIPFGAKTARAIARYLGQERPEGDSAWLWLGQGGVRWQEPRVRQLFETLGAAAGIVGKRVSPHVCRHTWATNAARDGLNPNLIQSLLGHQSGDMTRRYTRVAQLVEAGYRSHLDGLPKVK